MILGEQEIRRGFLKRIKRVKTKPQKQGTLNRARMLEHHIQHRIRVFVLETMKVILKYPTTLYSMMTTRILCIQ